MVSNEALSSLYGLFAPGLLESSLFPSLSLLAGLSLILICYLQTPAENLPPIPLHTAAKT